MTSCIPETIKDTGHTLLDKKLISPFLFTYVVPCLTWQ